MNIEKNLNSNNTLNVLVCHRKLCDRNFEWGKMTF